MVMKDKLYKNHRKGKSNNGKKAIIVLSSVIFLGAVIGVSTYLSKIDTAEKGGYAQEESSETSEDETSENSPNEENFYIEY